MSDHIVYPVNDLVDHELTGRRCWCRPRYIVPCDECEDAGCWKCDGGSIETSRDDPRSVVIIHNAADGRS